MRLKFQGTFEQLHDAIASIGVEGKWQPEPNGVFMFRCVNGANLHWATGTKTVWFDGPPAAVEQLTLQMQTNSLPDDQQVATGTVALISPP